MVSRARQARPHGADRHIQRDGGLGVAELGPVAERDVSRSSCRKEFTWSRINFIARSSSILSLTAASKFDVNSVPGSLLRSRLCRRIDRSEFRVALFATASNHGRIESPCSLTSFSAPGLKEHDTGQILCDGPRSSSPKAMVVDLIGVAFKKFTEGGAVMTTSSQPKFPIGYFVEFTPHNYIMSGSVP